MKHSIHIKKLLKITRDVLSAPGELWDQSSLEDKIKLQWFYFPEGIEIAENANRTPKICKLFNLKQTISPYQFPKVTHRNKKLNTHSLQISLPPQETIDTTSSEFWEELRDELGELTDILAKKNPLLLPQFPSLTRGHRSTMIIQ